MGNYCNYKYGLKYLDLKTFRSLLHHIISCFMLTGTRLEVVVLRTILRAFHSIQKMFICFAGFLLYLQYQSILELFKK